MSTPTTIIRRNTFRELTSGECVLQSKTKTKIKLHESKITISIASINGVLRNKIRYKKRKTENSQKPAEKANQNRNDTCEDIERPISKLLALNDDCQQKKTTKTRDLAYPSDCQNHFHRTVWKSTVTFCIIVRAGNTIKTDF